MKKFLLISIITMSASVMAQKIEPSEIDYTGFEDLTAEVYEYRQTRLISIDSFNLFSKDPNTIILDTRSKAAYDEVHIEGAIHLNFSDFTVGKLAKVIPNKETRILIYCNNNFISSLASLALKSKPLALNIPTFINLYGYGYENIYELRELLLETDERVKLVGTAIVR